MIVECAYCGKDFEKRNIDIKKYQNHFCTKTCHGKFRIFKNNSELFNRTIRLNNDCIVFSGSLNKDGYGRVRYNGKVMLSNRAAYTHIYGEIPENLCVCHKCDNPRCMNPEHLFLGTHQDNMEDMTIKGRRYTKDRGSLPQPPADDKE